MTAARVKKRSLDLDGNVVRISNQNKMIDTRVCDIMCMDGTVKHLAGNIVASTMSLQMCWNYNLHQLRLTLRNFSKVK